MHCATRRCRSCCRVSCGCPLPDVFPIRQVDQKRAEDIEYLGTKRKFWFTSNGQRYLFKAEERGTGEDWAEKIVCNIAAARIWLGKLNEISHNAMDAILAEVPPERMSPVTREFTLELLMINQRRLLESF